MCCQVAEVRDARDAVVTLAFLVGLHVSYQARIRPLGPGVCFPPSPAQLLRGLALAFSAALVGLVH